MKTRLCLLMISPFWLSSSMSSIIPMLPLAVERVLVVSLAVVLLVGAAFILAPGKHKKKN